MSLLYFILLHITENLFKINIFMVYETGRFKTYVLINSHSLLYQLYHALPLKKYKIKVGFTNSFLNNTLFTVDRQELSLLFFYKLITQIYSNYGLIFVWKRYELTSFITRNVVWDTYFFLHSLLHLVINVNNNLNIGSWGFSEKQSRCDILYVT